MCKQNFNHLKLILTEPLTHESNDPKANNLGIFQTSLRISIKQ